MRATTAYRHYEEVKTAYAAASAANAAAQAAVAARNLLYRDATAWGFADAAYWLCRAATEAAENAASSLDAEVAEMLTFVLDAHVAAMSAADAARNEADELIREAERTGRKIKR